MLSVCFWLIQPAVGGGGGGKGGAVCFRLIQPAGWGGGGGGVAVSFWPIQPVEGEGGGVIHSRRGEGAHGDEAGTVAKMRLVQVAEMRLVLVV